jgi:hypothetical protein
LTVKNLHYSQMVGRREVFEAKTGAAPATPPGLPRRRNCDLAIN